MTRAARPLAGLLAGLVLVLLASVALTACGTDSDGELTAAQEQVSDFTAKEDARRVALSAATAFVAEATSYSHRAGEHDFAWVGELLDDKVRGQFEERVPALQNAIKASRTTARGKVIQAAGTVVDPTQVEVLAFVEQTITDSAGESSIEQPTLSLTMKQVDGAWRVQSLEFLNQIGVEPAP